MAASPTPKPSSSDADGVSARVDQAHGLRSAMNASKAPEAESVSAPSLSAQHAEQLGAWLQKRHEESEERQRLIATQESDLQEKVEAAQQWLDERKADLDAREEELSSREQPEENNVLSLTEHQELKAREAELDRREAELARMTESIAADRAKASELQQRLADRVKGVEQKEEELAKSSQTLAEQAHALKLKAQECDERRLQAERLCESAQSAEHELAERERAIEMRQQEIKHALERYERLGVVEGKIAQLQEEAARFADRERHLERAEAIIEEERAALTERAEAITKREREGLDALSKERHQFETDHGVWRAEVESEAKRLRRLEDEVERREEGVTRLKGEIEATQRDVLEMRLATEETWAQLTGLLAPAALTRSIARVRAQLADYYSRIQEEIAESRGSLRDATQGLAEELDRLDRRRIETEEWAERRRQEIGEAADTLHAREQELNRQQLAYEQNEARWAAERTEYRQQIRLLLAEMRRDDDEPDLRLADAA